MIIEDEEAIRYWNASGSNLHREDGPAVVYKNGSYKAWYINGELHRIDGPAREYDPPFKYKYDDEYYYHGVEIKCKTLEEFKRIIELKAFWK